MHRRTNHARDRVSAAAARPREGQRRRPPTDPAEAHFDPQELTRRLYMVLAEQKAAAERRERARREQAKRGASSATRHRDVGANADRERKRAAAEPAADLITALRRTESAHRKQPPIAAPEVDNPSATTMPTSHYHHVPREAAKQFARTTTVDNMREKTDLVHKLSRRALKFHLQGPTQAARPAPGGDKTSTAVAVAPAELTRALSQSQARRDRVLDRNQFQRGRVLEEAARHEREQQGLLSRRKHTFQDELKHLSWPSSALLGNSSSPTSCAHHNRRSLVAMHLDPLHEDDSAAAAATMPSTLSPPHPEELTRFPTAAAAVAERARADWTQSDEVRHHRQQHQEQQDSIPSQSQPNNYNNNNNNNSNNNHHHHHRLLLLSPLLRKADSLWTLRGARKGSSKEEEEDERSCPPSSSSSGGADAEKKGSSVEEVTEKRSASGSEESPKARKGPSSFFTKFRR